jgi:hypothetical protein
MSNKQSSVEYLIEHLLPKALTVEQYYHIEKAKAMHKEEVTQAHTIGYIIGGGNGELYDPKQYYNETFEQ